MKKHRGAGLALLELLISLTLLIFIFSSGSRYFLALEKRYLKAQVRLDLQENLRFVDYLLRRQLLPGGFNYDSLPLALQQELHALKIPEIKIRSYLKAPAALEIRPLNGTEILVITKKIGNDITTQTFFIGKAVYHDQHTTPVTALYNKISGHPAEEICAHVKKLTVSYGVDLSGKGEITHYFTTAEMLVRNFEPHILLIKINLIFANAGVEVAEELVFRLRAGEVYEAV